MQTQKPWWKQPTRAQWAAFGAAWIGWVLDAFDFTIYITVALSIMKEFGVSATALGGSLTLTLIVRLAGGYIAGWMADRWGRKHHDRQHRHPRHHPGGALPFAGLRARRKTRHLHKHQGPRAEVL